jgi:hypothetical protein
VVLKVHASDQCQLITVELDLVHRSVGTTVATSACTDTC